jgi:hypothetical protein
MSKDEFTSGLYGREDSPRLLGTNGGVASLWESSYESMWKQWQGSRPVEGSVKQYKPYRLYVPAEYLT